MRHLLSIIVLLTSITASGTSIHERISPESFKNPPAEAGLDIWWHWHNGNISREGIRKDLISMHDNGIKRATILNVSGSGQFVPRVNYASDEWFDMFRYALEVADSLGMRIGVHNCDGWSTSGGPWITPEMSIKTCTWSNLFVHGGRTLDVELPLPTANFNFYKDFAIVAFPAERPASSYIDAAPTVSLNGNGIGDIFNDNNPKSYIKLHQGDKIRFSFAKPAEIGRIGIFRYDVFKWTKIDEAVSRFKLSISDDGVNFRPVGEVTFKEADKPSYCGTKQLKAKHFQLESIDGYYNLGEVELLRSGEEMAYAHGFTNFLTRTYDIKATSADDYTLELAPGATFIPEDKVIDLTDAVSADGRLHWKAPKGDWCIVRFGYTTTGVTNAPSTNEGRGFESDKMDAEATRLHFDKLPKKLVEAAGPYAGNTFQFILIDSWECQFPNWTAAFPEEFEKTAGYSIKKWLPVLCGYPVGDEAATQAFLHDYDRTIAALIDRNYYREMADLAHKYGIEIHSEPIYGNSTDYPPLDALKANAYCDMPMTEFWANPDESKQPAYHINDRNLDGFPIDVALTAGKRIIGAEAYTGNANFSELPQLLKPFGDAAYCSGVNQFILHSYVHQPLDRSPHLTLTDYFGGHYNRNNPWWQFAKEWSGYHARVQYLLQQGEPVIDALYYIGDQYPENFPRQMLHEDMPRGYRAGSCNFDYLDKVADAGFTRLIIPQGVMIEAETAAKLEELKAAGVEIYHARNGVRIPFDTAPDFKVLEEGDHFKYIHKKTDKEDIYFVFNQEERPVRSDFIFRVCGHAPEIWNPENGETFAPANWHKTADGRTCVSISFEPRQSLFVVFPVRSAANAEPAVSGRSQVSGMSVKMAFEPFYDCDIAAVECDGLKSLTEFSDEEIKYFGGIVDYTIRFDTDARIDGAGAVALDLGRIGGVAEVKLNGKVVDYMWKDHCPVLVDNLRNCGNVLEVRLGTTLRNRIAGDMKLFGKPVHIETPTAVGQLPSGDNYLEASGLLGPISIITYK